MSIGIGAKSTQDETNRLASFAAARVGLISDLVSRGHSLHEAAQITDYVVEGAHKLSSALIAHIPRAHPGPMSHS